LKAKDKEAIQAGESIRPPASPAACIHNFYNPGKAGIIFRDG
jgi:alkylated DNA repair dioxygenase AlkB